MKFALYFGNRGFFPGQLIASARIEVCEALKSAGHDFILMGENETKYGAVETIEEGKKYAEFLKKNEGNYDGVIVSLPNFGDENGASRALQDVKVPILIQAYPDEEGKMDFNHRRDSLCGKIAMCNVLRQCNIKYTLLEPFTVDPKTDEFQKNIRDFSIICNVVNGMKRFNIGTLGARTSAFKTVRFDEIALQKHGINVETIDLSSLFAIMDYLTDEDIINKKTKLYEMASFKGFKEEKVINLAKLGVAIDILIEKYELHAISIRCWDELQKRYGIAPCIILSELNERGIAASCETDVTNSVAMRILTLASGTSMLLDVNNNFNNDNNKCIMFHCGPAPISLLKGKGEVIEHLMFKKTYGNQSGVGLYKGDIFDGTTTFTSMKTEDGKLYFYLGNGEFTTDKIEKEFFGIGKVFESKSASEIINYIAKNGFRHHMAFAKGDYVNAVYEAMTNYLGYEVKKF